MSWRKPVAVPWRAAWVACALLAAVLGVSAAKASAAPYRTEVLSDSPRAYWRLGETHGGQAADETANNLRGAYQNGVTLGVPGAIPDGDNAARFDGVDDQVNMGDPSSGGLDFGTGDFTVEAWIRTAVNGEQVIASKQGFSGPFWQITVTDDFGATGTIRARLNNGSVTRQAYGPALHVDDGAWHHVVVLFGRSSGITIYIDKTFVRQTSGAMTGNVSNSASLLVGGRTIDTYPAFNGDIDEVAVYPELLTPSRIQAHYDAVMADDVTPPSASISSPTQNSFVNDKTPTFSGVAGMAVGDQAAVNVKIYSGSLATGTPVETVSTTRDSTGAWSADASPALPQGTYTAQAEQDDAVGHTGGSIPVTFSVVQPPPESPTDPVLVAAGDIADCSSNGDEQTAALLDDIPGTVGTLGDNAYESGTDVQFANCYDPTWGRHRARTRPSPGDHDYETPGAAGYFQYFGAAAGDPAKGYYSYDLGTWHIVMLNSNCGEIGGCDAGSAQEQWLRSDLAAHPTGCTLSVLGNPLFSSNNHVGNDVTMKDLWQALHEHRTDVMLTADDHDYERFAAQDPNGRLDLVNGITEFVVGTGGRSHYTFPVGLPASNSQVRNDDTFGVMKLALHPGGYDWNFVPVAGKTFTDSGSRSCHNPTVQTGTIVVKKDAHPNDPRDFDFTAAGGLSPQSFSLDDDSDPTLSDTYTFTSVPTGGGYSISEAEQAGWDQTGATCDDGSSPSNIDIAPGETVTCTFTNRKRGQVLVVESSTPNDPQDFDFTAGGGLSPPGFSLDDDSDPALQNTHTFPDVVPGGDYSLDETVPSGWDLTSSSCDDGGSPSNIDVAPGETVTCTFTNQKRFYGSPHDAGLLQVSLVPAYKQCGTPANPGLARHAAPLAVESCPPPAPASSIARIGDSNVGTVAIAVTDGDFAIQIDDSDIRTPAETDYDPSPAGSADLSLSVRVRRTDLDSCTPSPCSEPYQDAATLTDFEFGAIPVQCIPAGDSTGPPGSDCQASASANSFIPGFVAAGKRTVLQLFRVRVLDANNALFQQQGIFTP
jgi:hypothetical protein